MNKNKLMILTASCLILCALGGCGSNASSANETTAVTTTVSSDETTAETTAVSTDGTEAASSKEAFPVSVDDEKLSLESVFQFSGMNPDKNMEEQENICSIQLKNVSGEYLANAAITLTCEHGETYHFAIEDLPDGMTVYAYDTDNKTCELVETVQDIQVDAEYDPEGTGLLDTDITASFESPTVTLKNIGSDACDNLLVTYHDSMDGILFGGTSYDNEVSGMEKDSDVSFQVDDAILGEAVVTSVTEK